MIRSAFQRLATACAAAMFAPLTAHAEPIPFANPVLLSEGRTLALEAIDVDGDCDLDLVVGNLMGGLVWYENDGTGSLGERRAIDDAAFTPIAIHAADANGIGRLGLLVGTTQGARHYGWTSEGFDEAAPLDSAAVRHSSIATGDLDNDGYLDAVVAVSNGPFSSGSIEWWKGPGLASRGPLTDMGTGFGARDARIADLDGDGDLDVVFVSEGDGAVSWLPNRLDEASMDFGPAKPIATLSRPLALAVADFDADGDDDVAVTALDDEIVWYENRLADPSADFGPKRVITTAADNPQRLVPAYVDGDGDIDLVGSSYDDGEVAWYDNDGHGGFTRRLLPGTVPNVLAIEVADLDRDGVPEIIAAGSQPDQIAIYRNPGAGRPATAYANVRRLGSPGTAVLSIDGQSGDVELLNEGDGFLSYPTDVVMGPDGDYYVADSGRIIRIQSDTGAQQVVASGELLGTGIAKLAFEAQGTLLATWRHGSTGEVVRINPSTGAQTLVKRITNGVTSISGPAVTKDFDILVGIAYNYETAHLFRINPATGALVQLATIPGIEDAYDAADLAVASDGEVFFLLQAGRDTGIYRLDAIDGFVPHSIGERFSSPTTLAIAPSGELFVVDPFARSIFRVNRASGAQGVVSVGPFGFPNGLAFDPTGDLVVADFGPTRLVAVDPSSGATQDLSTGRVLSPFDLALDGAGDIWLTDIGAQALLRLDPGDGALEEMAVLKEPRHLAFESSGSLLLGSFSLLHRFDPVTKSLRFLADLDVQTHDLVANERPLVLDYEELFEVRLPQGTTTRIGAAPGVRRIARLEDGALIASRDRTSMARLNESTGVFHPLVVDGLITDYGGPIAPVPGGGFWTTGYPNRVQEVRPAVGVVRSFCPDVEDVKDLAVSAVPEPGVTPAAGAALFVLMLLRRRSRTVPA